MLQCLGSNHRKAAEAVAVGVIKGCPVVVIVGGCGDQPLSAAEHLDVFLFSPPVELLLFTAVVINLKAPQTLQRAEITDILHRPAGVVILHQKPLRSLGDHRIPVRGAVLLSGRLLVVRANVGLLLVFGKKVQMKGGAVLLLFLPIIRAVQLHRRQRQKILPLQLRVRNQLTMVGKGYDLVALPTVGLRQLLYRTLPVG